MIMHTRVIDFATPEFDQFLYLRDIVLRKPLKKVFYEEDIAEEFNQIHVGCYSNQSELIGGLILNPISIFTVKMRQVAVIPSLQGKGIGSFIVKASEQLAMDLGYKNIELSARSTAVKFYKNLDYEVISDVYEEVGIPHQKMRKTL